LKPRTKALGLVALLAGCADERVGFEQVALELRPDSPSSNETFRYRPEDVVRTHDLTDVRVHFVEGGPHAVPARDEDGDGVPDYVEMVAERYQAHLLAYEELGFRRPLSDATLTDDDGGDGRFDVYLLDFFGSADGAFSTDACVADTCIGYAVQENDFVGYGYPSLERATDILASHELFHAVQNAYDAGQGSIMNEGTAVWATETLVPASNDFEAFAGGYLAEPHRALDQEVSGVVLDPFAYGSALFFRFLTDFYDDPDLVRRLWEDCEDGQGGVPDPQWLSALDRRLASDFGSSFRDAFSVFAIWNAFTGSERSDLGPTHRGGEHLPPVEADEIELPVVLERPRHFRASSRYRHFFIDEERRIEAALVGPDEDLNDLHLVLVLWGPQGAHYVESDGSESVVGLDVGSAQEGFVVVVNTRTTGGSSRASLCVGDPPQTEACRAEFSVSDPTEPEPEPDPGPEPDPEPEPSENAPNPGSNDLDDAAGGCRGTAPSTTSMLLALTALGALMRRRPRSS